MRDVHDPQLDGLQAFVIDCSYYSGKLEAYLRYKEIPHERIEVAWSRVEGEIARATDEARVPALRLGNGAWLTDTTPMIDWLETVAAGPSIVPDDPADAFIVRLVEDYADEWLWRPAMHYRWSFATDRLLMGHRLASEIGFDTPLPVWLKAAFIRRRQYWRYVRGDGVTSETRGHVEEIYLRTLRHLEAILETQRFVLGGRPSLADFGLFASMFRHFGLDPTPAYVMRQQAPRVMAWVMRLWNATASVDVGEFTPGIPGTWDPLLDDVGAEYLPYLADNAKAVADGVRRFDNPLSCGVTYRNLRAEPYRAWCRTELQDRFEALPDDAASRVRTRLEAHGCWEPLWRHGRIASGVSIAGHPERALGAA